MVSGTLRRRFADIPGLSIALIRDGGLVWTEGFGLTNTLTRGSVTSETLFEIASNSKVVTAYAALRLVDQGILDLDIDNRAKMALVEKCGEIECRMTEGSDEFLQLEALLAQFTLAKK